MRISIGSSVKGRSQTLLTLAIAIVIVLLWSVTANAGDADTVAGTPADADGLGGVAGERDGVGSVPGDGEAVSGKPGDLNRVLGRRRTLGDQDGITGRPSSYLSSDFWFVMSTVGVWRLR